MMVDRNPGVCRVIVIPPNAHYGDICGMPETPCYDKVILVGQINKGGLNAHEAERLMSEVTGHGCAPGCPKGSLVKDVDTKLNGT